MRVRHDDGKCKGGDGHSFISKLSEMRRVEGNDKANVWNISYASPWPFFKPPLRKILPVIFLTQRNMPHLYLIICSFSFGRLLFLKYLFHILILLMPLCSLQSCLLCSCHRTWCHGTIICLSPFFIHLNYSPSVPTRDYIIWFLLKMLKKLNKEER